MRGAILIIGSLLWDRNEVREKWRQSRLDLSKLAIVAAPIRYARRSASRGDTFTMTFAGGDVKGQAVVVPCRQEVSTVDAMAQEAKALWQVEQPTAQLDDIAANWGCVAAVFRSSDLAGAHRSWTEFFCARAKPIWP